MIGASPHSAASAPLFFLRSQEPAGDGYICLRTITNGEYTLRKALRRRLVAEPNASRRQGTGLGGLIVQAGLREPTTGDIRKEHTVFGKRPVAQLEIVFRLIPDEGSNPSLSAITYSNGKALEEVPQEPFYYAFCDFGQSVAVATTE